VGRVTTTPQQVAARAEVAGRLAAFREARATVHADIRRAAELGMTTTEIAQESGMTWHGVAKVLNREDRS
jgi:predicted transcriptional regulator